MPFQFNYCHAKIELADAKFDYSHSLSLSIRLCSSRDADMPYTPNLTKRFIIFLQRNIFTYKL